MRIKGDVYCKSGKETWIMGLRMETPNGNCLCSLPCCLLVNTLKEASKETSKTYSIGKPLIEQTQNVALEILNNKTPQQKSSNANCDLQLIVDHLTDGNSNLSQNSSCRAIQATDKVVVQPHVDFQERRERELKFIATGWKRDCLGKWFRHENVEFDSDEDDPNVCLG